MCKRKKSRFILPILTAALTMSSLPFSSVFAANTPIVIEKQLVGDINNNGQVDLVDALMLKSYVLKKNISIKLLVGDMNGDSVINGIDYLLLKKSLMTPIDPADTKVAKANTDFAFDIFKAVNKGDDANKNVFISPLSISTALSMVYEGAGSSTKEEMTNALRYKGLDINTINQGYKSLLEYLNNADPKVTLSINNSIWYRDGFKVNDNFINTNKDVFNTYVSPLNFSDPKAADTINSWISNATNKMIPSMIDPPIPDNAVMYLINAIYFKGQWTNIFDGKLSDYGYFRNGKDQSKQVVYMKKEHVALDLAEGTDYKAVRLPYGDGSTAMYCILPDSSIPINDFISNLNTDKWNSIKQSIKKTKDVKLLLPRFKMEYGAVSLNDSLQSLGINSAFTNKADFSGIAPNIYINDVEHKAVVEVNENGTEAAAVTVVMMPTCIPDPTPEFIANRPFIFVIADEKKGNILFLGKAFDLEEKKPL